MTTARHAPRPISPFESKRILDYVKGLTLNSIKYACVRAKELDDKGGSKRNTDYLLAMHELSNALRAELGLKAAPIILKSKINKSDKKLVTRIEELEKELLESKANLETMSKEVTDLEEVLEAATGSVAELTNSNKLLHETNEALISTNKDLIKKATVKKVNKPAAKPTKKETK